MQKAQEEELNQMKFRFFTNISHEFRTPLTLIITPLESLIKEVGDMALKKRLQSIYRNSKELLNLVNQLLDFRRLEVHGEKLFLVKGNIAEFVSSIKSSFDYLAQEKEISFEIDDKITEDLYISFDREKIQKVLNNLLSNAFKFTPAGGRVTITFDTCKESDGVQYFRLCVKDTGTGIPRKNLSHIFERFYQVKEEEDKIGSGIGLHLVKEYVELHSGKIEVESEVNKGSLFTVYLPVRTDVEVDTELPEVEDTFIGILMWKVIRTCKRIKSTLYFWLKIIKNSGITCLNCFPRNTMYWKPVMGKKENGLPLQSFPI